MKQKVVTLDVREDIRAGRQPCSSIMSAVGKLKEGESLRLLAPFEPKPLFEVLGNQGFAHTAKPIGEGDWEVLFYRDAAMLKQAALRPASQTGTSACGCSAATAQPPVEVDVRGLEPPQPMVRILEMVDSLPNGATLQARTDRRPMHLYPLLEQRGYVGESEEQGDGSCVTRIRRK